MSFRSGSDPAFHTEEAFIFSSSRALLPLSWFPSYMLFSPPSGSGNLKSS